MSNKDIVAAKSVRKISKNRMTYTKGLTLKTKKVIIKNDIITLCQLLNNREEYSNFCEFQPEGILGGGIKFKFNDTINNDNSKWYKSVRLMVECYPSKGKWYWVTDENVFSEWSGNNDVVYPKNNTFSVFL